MVIKNINFQQSNFFKHLDFIDFNYALIIKLTYIKIVQLRMYYKGKIIPFQKAHF